MKNIFEYHREKIRNNNYRLSLVVLGMLNNLTEKEAKKLYNNLHKDDKDFKPFLID